MADPISALDMTATAADPRTAVDETLTTEPRPISLAIANGADDAVSFSIPAQVFLLAQQGAEVRQIASKLDVSSEQVVNDLDLVVAAIGSIAPSSATAK